MLNGSSSGQKIPALLSYIQPAIPATLGPAPVIPKIKLQNGHEQKWHVTAGRSLCSQCLSKSVLQPINSAKIPPSCGFEN